MSTISFYDSSEQFTQIFQQTKHKLQKVLPQAEIHHVGSTAVPNLGGKGIIDILIAIPNWKEYPDVVEKLKTIGFTHVHPPTNERIFLSQKANTQYGDIHLHLTYIDSPEYKKLLAFRDYLRSHPEEAQNYARLKKLWLKQAVGDRHLYGQLKSTYINSIAQKVLQPNVS